MNQPIADTQPADPTILIIFRQFQDSTRCHVQQIGLAHEIESRSCKTCQSKTGIQSTARLRCGNKHTTPHENQKNDYIQILYPNDIRERRPSSNNWIHCNKRHSDHRGPSTPLVEHTAIHATNHNMQLSSGVWAVNSYCIVTCEGNTTVCTKIPVASCPSPSAHKSREFGIAQATGSM